jgi:DNA helicase HerA-like ATPase
MASDDPDPGKAELGESQAILGHVPGTRFPVVVDLRELSLHHGAILGTTGTGKTHLAFDIARRLADLGTMVVCVDSTGQYARRFRGATSLTTRDAAGFVSAGGGGIGIVELDSDSILQGKALAEALFRWAKGSGLRVEPDKPAHCVVVFEEAQNLVPEGFVVDKWELKTAAQSTSQIIMESRKYGLGFLLVSQRTAMVTKSALSQCNTLFAFQAVDQTGLDYFEGLCGSTLVKSVPTLPHRTAIAMGRGLASTRPVIMHASDAEEIVS